MDFSNAIKQVFYQAGSTATDFAYIPILDAQGNPVGAISKENLLNLIQNVQPAQEETQVPE